MARVEDVLALDIRVGTIVAARRLSGARWPTVALSLDLGEAGTSEGAVRIGNQYDTDELVGLQVLAIVNLPEKRVAGTSSKALVLSVEDARGDRILAIPERPVPDGRRVG